jgi:DNA-binding transcriptional regulator YdaS (Cro superfamily)
MSQHQAPPTLQQLARAAVAAAGRSPAVAEALGVSTQAVSRWMSTGYIPAERIQPLCDLGRNIVTPAQILDALARSPRQRGGRRGPRGG